MTCDSAIPYLGIYHHHPTPLSHKCTKNVYCSFIHDNKKIGSRPKFLSRRSDKQWFECYSQEKANYWFTQCRWISKNLVSRRNQTQKSTYCIILLSWCSRKEETNLWGLKSEQWSPHAVNSVRKGAQELPGVMVMPLFLIRVLFT